MPIYTDPYDTGGGSTTSVCQISPSDNIAVLSNYGNRIADIERFLSRVVAADVHANNLSELADNMGNLLNGTLMMPYSTNNSWAGVGGSVTVPDGFTGTFTSGNVTTIWNNGVVTFQVTPQDGVTAGMVGVEAAVFANVDAADDSTTSGVTKTLTIDTELSDSIGLALNSNAISGFDSGVLYLVAANIQVDGTTNYQTVNVNVFIDSVDYDIGNQYNINFNSSTYGFNTPFTANLVGATTISGAVRVKINITRVPTNDVLCRVNSLAFIRLS